MKIRFLQDWPRIKDKNGAFALFCAGESRGPSVIEIIEAHSPDELPQATVRIYAQSEESSQATLLCYRHFCSCAEAATEMADPGIDIIRDPVAESFAQRCIDAKKAEQIK